MRGSEGENRTVSAEESTRSAGAPPHEIDATRVHYEDAPVLRPGDAGLLTGLVTMRHALMYVGGFERNFKNLTTASTSFEGSDGQQHAYPAWPSSVNGLRISYMEKAGKKFVAVRVSDGIGDVVLQNEMVMVPGEHFGFGVHLSGEPTSVEDNIAIMKMLEDIIKKNMGLSGPLMEIRTRFKAAASKK
jgi:hypothetical protein